MRSGLALVLAGLLTTGCAWSPVQTSPEAEPKPLPDLVRVETTTDSMFAVRAPNIRSDTLRGYFRLVTHPPFARETGPLVERTLPMANVRKVTSYRVTPGSAAAYIAGSIAGWCLGRTLGGAGCF